MEGYGTRGSTVICLWLAGLLLQMVMGASNQNWSRSNDLSCASLHSPSTVGSSLALNLQLLLTVFAVDRSVNDGMKFNKETEFVPILGLLEAQLNSPSSDGSASESEKAKKSGSVNVTASDIQGNHHPALLSLLAEELSVRSEEIQDFELCVLLRFLAQINF